MKALVSINYHRFHEESELMECLTSTQLAVSRARKQGLAELDLVLFKDSRRPLSEDFVSLLAAHSATVINQDGDSGGARLNEQIDIARSANCDIMFRVDADDVVYENRFEEQLRYLDQYPEIGICGGGLDYHRVDGEDSYTVMPPERPSTWDYLANSYCLHPTFAMRLDRLDPGLRYHERRIEDKRYILDARTQGVNFGNVQSAVGTYRLGRSTRSGIKYAWWAFQLDWLWSWRFKPWASIPAVVIGLARAVLPVDWLRGVRQRLFFRQAG